MFFALLVACAPDVLDVETDDGLEWHQVEYGCGEGEEVVFTFDEEPTVYAHLLESPDGGWYPAPDDYPPFYADGGVQVDSQYVLGGGRDDATFCLSLDYVGGRVTWAYPA